MQRAALGRGLQHGSAATESADADVVNALTSSLSHLRSTHCNLDRPQRAIPRSRLRSIGCRAIMAPFGEISSSPATPRPTAFSTPNRSRSFSACFLTAPCEPRGRSRSNSSSPRRDSCRGMVSRNRRQLKSRQSRCLSRSLRRERSRSSQVANRRWISQHRSAAGLLASGARGSDQAASKQSLLDRGPCAATVPLGHLELAVGCDPSHVDGM